MTVAPPRAHAPARAARRPWSLLAAAFVVVAVAAGIALRFVTRSELWLDEALSVSIARLPLGDLPEALRHDGAPPLYYVLLHGWIDVFGDGNVAVRALSGIFAVAALPLAWAAGRRLGGRPVAVSALVVLATSTFHIRFATEARMYALEMFLVLAGYLALCRALERPVFGRLALVAAATGLLLYTQYWALYLVAVVGALLAWRAWRQRDRAARSALAAVAAGCLTLLPWAGIFLYQLRNTGTPWGEAVTPVTAVGGTALAFAGGEHAEGIALVAPLVLLALLAVFGRAVDRRRIELDLRTVPGVRWEAVVAVATLTLGALASFAGGTAYQSRYASIMFPLFALVVAFGITVFADHRLRAGALVLVALLGLVGGVRNAREQRTQAFQAAGEIRARARPGDVVVYCPDQVGPDVSRLLPAELGLAQVRYPDLGDPRFVDWVDYAERHRSADPAAVATAVLDLAGPVQDVWLVWAPGYRHVTGQCEALADALARDRPGRTTLVLPDDAFFEFQGLLRFPPP